VRERWLVQRAETSTEVSQAEHDLAQGRAMDRQTKSSVRVDEGVSLSRGILIM
jgi:hypothetical protein